MEMLILKTDINSRYDFRTVKKRLKGYYRIDECTIDLDDRDKVVRLVGNKIEANDIVSKIKSYGFLCEELPD
ncbi:MAG: hypothetical protein WAM24_22345 [Ignavibacteriaceae bacterium]